MLKIADNKNRFAAVRHFVYAAAVPSVRQILKPSVTYGVRLAAYLQKLLKISVNGFFGCNILFHIYLLIPVIQSKPRLFAAEAGILITIPRHGMSCMVAALAVQPRHKYVMRYRAYILVIIVQRLNILIVLNPVRNIICDAYFLPLINKRHALLQIAHRCKHGRRLKPHFPVIRIVRNRARTVVIFPEQHIQKLVFLHKILPFYKNIPYLVKLKNRRSILFLAPHTHMLKLEHTGKLVSAAVNKLADILRVCAPALADREYIPRFFPVKKLTYVFVQPRSVHEHIIFYIL